MAGGLIAEIPKPKRIHVILSKLMGGTMVFWVLWRLKHDWQEIVVRFLIEYNVCLSVIARGLHFTEQSDIIVSNLNYVFLVSSKNKVEVIIIGH